ncbi:Phage Tail Collar Domain protein [Vibrio aerogenes CECT 7868]|uniref:Phage Tail Collar Domain protein n=1 Tax=Vibrio aerogenes CECT 7868 TaxID=1216006 RepID=A0A1M5VM91_9VIBR|nr:phage tail protein [Vibrio aerogenes]SHH76376.1 Phage Tail Collar Domain protein [Vibrio aerogenes CECT 7868]
MNDSQESGIVVSSAATQACPFSPAGAVIAYAGVIETNPSKTPRPFDWLLCNGATVDIAVYPALFAALQNRYGGDGKTTFAVPDYQGTFLRGVDDGTHFSGSTEHRTAPKHGGTNQVGSRQDYALINHQHAYQHKGSGMVTPSDPPAGSAISATNETFNTDRITQPSDPYISQTEIRPVNTFVYWLIKAR